MISLEKQIRHHPGERIMAIEEKSLSRGPYYFILCNAKCLNERAARPTLI